MRVVAVGLVGACIVVAASPAVAADFIVAPGGTPDGDGSSTAPWDLATAFAQPATVAPGDTIWLSGGTYAGVFTSELAGTAEAPITVRSAPGEWARLDLPAAADTDALTFRGAWTVYRDFEILSSDPSTPRALTSVAVSGTDLLLANLVIHDGGNNMFHGTGSEIYGSIFYNNGTDGDDLAHHLYAQNEDPARPSHITDCLIFNGYAFGVHAYATHGHVSGMHMVGNVWFGNGVAQTEGDRKDNCLVGSIDFEPENIVLAENFGWAASPSDRSVALGRYHDINADLEVTNNRFVGATDFTNPWQTLAVTGNTFIGPVTGAIELASYPDNEYLAEEPLEPAAFVRPNRLDPKRAHVIVYNPALADTVEVDLSTVLAAGDEYELRNGQNFFAPPVTEGTYDGAPVALPMAAGDDPALPIGPGQIEPNERTGKAFNVFVLLPRAQGLPVDGGGGGHGAGGHGAAGSGVGATAPGAPAETDGGCGCRIASQKHHGHRALLCGLGLGLALSVRRARSCQRPGPSLRPGKAGRTG